MSEFNAVLEENELQGGAMRAVEVGGVPVLVSRSEGGEVCAIANTCTHMGGPLNEGERDGDVVTCPWHGSQFDRELAQHAHARRVREDLRGGLKSGVEGTPTFFVNGLRHDGPNDLATLRAAVEEAAR